MAVKRDEERVLLIEKLVTQYGLSSSEIAGATGISEHTIAADRHRERMSSVKLSRQQKFQKLLADYSLCMFLSPSGSHADFCKVLERALKAPEIVLKLKGMEEAAKALCITRFASDDKPFYDLLISVFQKSLFEIPNPKELWHEYLHDVHMSVMKGGNVIWMLPDSHDALITKLAYGYTDAFHGAIKLKWTSKIGQMIREGIIEILEGLTEKESTIVKMRFGIEYDRKYTRSEIGKHLDIDKERVRQIEAQAIRKLKNPSMLLGRIPLIYVLLGGNKELFFLYQQRCAEVARLKEALAYEEEFKIPKAFSAAQIKFLATPIDELYLSVRACNSLKNANFKYLGDAAQKTDCGLLRTRNFGRKSIREIREILQKNGMDFGIRLDETSQALYEKLTAKDR
ncbi:MAG: DNA-directed RNA polymerase subunit alpha [Parcubacteria group bacterium Gr01-1014_66]|nr:MAG: DNA-directed RNA polymerase subunit alpha [Parcubacteria group bacterium Gr01-1014_66]